MEPLTQEQINWAMRRMSKWLRVRAQEAERDFLKNEHLLGSPEKTRSILYQISADVDHSALLLRLLQGKDELPEPPPLQHSYPVYPD